MSDVCIIHVTCPDTAVAHTIADTLVAERAAACVSIVPGLQSVYRWQGRIEHDAQVLLLIKTTTRCCECVQQRVFDMHPDELPEVIAVPVTQGLPGYLDWVASETQNTA